jgi:hypothetical protein
MVHQHPDGFVYVRQDGVTRYADTTENFFDDFKIMLPPLPTGGDERIYEPGKRHAIHNREGHLVEGGSRQWDVGDRIIAALSEAKAAKAARQPPPFDQIMAMTDEERQQFNKAYETWKEKEIARLTRIRTMMPAKTPVEKDDSPTPPLE